LKASAVGDFGHDSVNDQITQFVQAYEQTATSMRIRGSFCKAGLTQHISSSPFKLKFDEDRPCESKGFRKIWERDVTIEELSRIWQNHRFGMINAEFMTACFGGILDIQLI
jgi:hypothetical protein